MKRILELFNGCKARVAFSVLAIYSLMIQPAFAQVAGDGLRGLVTQLRDQFGAVPDLIMVLSFVGGIILFLLSLMHFWKWSKNSNQVDIGPGVAKFVVGIAMVGLPWMAGLGLDTFGIGGDGVTSATGTLQSIR